MRVNERQEKLVRSKPKEWLEIVTTGCHAGKWRRINERYYG